MYWSSDVCSSDLPERDLPCIVRILKCNASINGGKRLDVGYRLRHRIMTDRSLRAAVIGQAGTQIHCQAGAKRNGIVGVCTRIPFRSEWHPVAGKVSKYPVGIQTRSEEHTSELQSLMRNSYAVYCLKKK